MLVMVPFSSFHDVDPAVDLTRHGLFRVLGSGLDVVWW